MTISGSDMREGTCACVCVTRFPSHPCKCLLMKTMLVCMGFTGFVKILKASTVNSPRKNDCAGMCAHLVQMENDTSLWSQQRL